MTDFCVVGIDGGGSKTECAIVDSGGKCLGTGIGGSSNINYVDAGSVREAVGTACRLADQSAGPRRPAVKAIGCAVLRAREQGSADVSPDPGASHIEQALKERFGGELRYYTEGEVALACIGAYDRVGVACIAGTGSSCFGFGGDGRRILRGGWGSPLGDEGGAYDIAVQGIRAAGRAFENRGPQTLLTDLAAQFFDEEIDGWFLRKLGPGIAGIRAEVALFAKSVSHAAEEGDYAAKEILDNTAKELSVLVLCTAKALFGPENNFPVALHGGVFTNGSVAEATSRLILDEFPLARVQISNCSPGVGAAMLTLHDISSGVAERRSAFE